MILSAVLLAATALLSLPGCTEEDWSDCDVLFELQFSYTHNPTESERFGEEVHSVDLFVFDKGGLFVKKMRVESASFGPGYTVQVPVPATGRYSVVAVGNLTADYHAGQLISYTGGCTEMVPGQSKLEDFRLMYNCTGGTSAQKLSDLFHGFLADLDTDMEYVKRYTFPVIKNTNTIQVTIQSLQKVLTRSLYPQVTVDAESCNSTYYFDNRIDGGANRISYRPYARSIDGTDLKVELSVLRLTCDGSLPFRIRKDGTELRTVDLIPEIQKNPAYATDSDLDKEDTYRIVITFETAGDVTITVNDWVTTHSSGTIG